MHRTISLVLTLLLLAGNGSAGARNRSDSLDLTIQEPRPAPRLPVALVPFRIGDDFCRRGQQPIVTFEVYNSLGKPEATLYLRSKRFEVLQALKLGCGDFVAIWDGTINSGQRLANPAVYYLRLVVGGERTTRKLVVPGP